MTSDKIVVADTAPALEPVPDPGADVGPAGEASDAVEAGTEENTARAEVEAPAGAEPTREPDETGTTGTTVVDMLAVTDSAPVDDDDGATDVAPLEGPVGTEPTPEREGSGITGTTLVDTLAETDPASVREERGTTGERPVDEPVGIEPAPESDESGTTGIMLVDRVAEAEPAPEGNDTGVVDTKLRLALTTSVCDEPKVVAAKELPGTGVIELLPEVGYDRLPE